MEIARKVTIGGINGVRKGFKGIKEKTFVARILGIVNDARIEDGQLGAYVKFTGEFQATNMDGVVTAAPVCMLPEPASGMLHSAFENSDGSVKFGFDFFVVPDESVAIGYKYSTVPLVEAKPSNPLADMLQSMPALPALAAPKQPELPIAPDAEKPAENPTNSAEAKPAKKK
jgi:hypothetical protein